ncbi:hypothetical protein D3C77_579350 [compost metagenome]
MRPILPLLRSRCIIVDVRIPLSQFQPFAPDAHMCAARIFFRHIHRQLVQSCPFALLQLQQQFPADELVAFAFHNHVLQLIGRLHPEPGKQTVFCVRRHTQDTSNPVLLPTFQHIPVSAPLILVQHRKVQSSQYTDGTRKIKRFKRDPLAAEVRYMHANKALERQSETVSVR